MHLFKNTQFFHIFIKISTLKYQMCSICIYIYIHVISKRCVTPQYIKYNSKALGVVQSLYFGSKLPICVIKFFMFKRKVSNFSSIKILSESIHSY